MSLRIDGVYVEKKIQSDNYLAKFVRVEYSDLKDGAIARVILNLVN